MQIIKMLEYCGMSYCDVQPILKNQELIFINDKDTDVQCFVRIERSSLSIVFRGSDSPKDWKTDFKFWQTTVPYGNKHSDIRVHSGFINAYKSKNVRDKIHKIVRENSVEKIILSGHSYGAALAVLCAVDLQYNFPNKDYEVVVFGCPRVGNNAFQKSYNLRLFKTIRVEHKKDIITKIPFVLMGYRHVGAKIQLGSKSFFEFCDMKHHALQNYYSLIWKL